MPDRRGHERTTAEGISARKRREQLLLPLPRASSATGPDSLGIRIQALLRPEGGPKDLKRQYVHAVLGRYLWLPGTPSRTSRHDRRLARALYERGIPLIVVDAALLLGTARLAFRGPQRPALPRVRALAYFQPLVTEVLEDSRDPDHEYLAYLLGKLRPLAEIKAARLRHQTMNPDTG